MNAFFEVIVYHVLQNNIMDKLHTFSPQDKIIVYCHRPFLPFTFAESRSQINP